MTEQHPLTDEKCKDLMQGLPKYASEIEDDDVIKVIRAAADWQLEQVIEWLEEKGLLRYVYGDAFATLDTYEVIADLRKAMRPQEES